MMATESLPVGTSGEQLFRKAFQAMASPCEIVVAGASGADVVDAVVGAIAEVHRIESKYSRYRDDSILSRINASAGGDWVECDAETLSLLEFANALHANSDGLFDITSGVLRRVWDFKRGRIPDQAAIDAVLPLVSWAHVRRNRTSVRLALAGMEIDFGGFGKEYAVDRATAMLEAAGVTGGYVNLGGDMRVIGPKPDGQPWQMGIRHPRIERKLVASIPITCGALATSGDYERYFEHNGRRYCHVLDPTTGRPVSHWQSISVLAPTAAAAGSMTTIAMLKQAEAIDYLDACGFDYLAIDHAGAVFQSTGQQTQTAENQTPGETGESLNKGNQQ